jgi:cytochrome c-type biogenesis protein CcmE
MTPLVRNRLILVGALLVAGSGFAVLSFGKMGENLVYYWSPAEMISQGEKAFGPTIRLGGVVKPGSIKWNPEHTNLDFQIATDHKPDAVAVTVHSTEVPPAMFREGIGVVVEGTFDKSQVFSSNRLMVNHSNEYRAPKPGEAPRKWQDTLEGSTTASNTTGAK